MNLRAQQAEATRERILEVAVEAFGQLGYDETSIEEVLRRSGVSRGALYHHFPGKEALFEAVLDRVEADVLRQVASVAASAGDPLSMLRAGVAAWLDVVMDPAVRRISLIDAPTAVGWQKWREIDERYGFGMLKGALQAAADAGMIRDQPVDMLAHLFLAAMGEAALVVARASDTDTARAEAERTLLALLDAIAVDGDR